MRCWRRCWSQGFLRSSAMPHRCRCRSRWTWGRWCLGLWFPGRCRCLCGWWPSARSSSVAGRSSASWTAAPQEAWPPPGSWSLPHGQSGCCRRCGTGRVLSRSDLYEGLQGFKGTNFISKRFISLCLRRSWKTKTYKYPRTYVIRGSIFRDLGSLWSSVHFISLIYTAHDHSNTVWSTNSTYNRCLFITKWSFIYDQLLQGQRSDCDLVLFEFCSRILSASIRTAERRFCSHFKWWQRPFPLCRN